MSNASRFQFIKSQYVPTLTVLHAAIEDFSYDRHAHEEYAFGVTLAGRQDFFSSGQFHRSPPGRYSVQSGGSSRRPTGWRAHAGLPDGVCPP